MRQLVIIGNGFDLAHGLKTSYKDFIIWYLNTALKNLCANREYGDDIIQLTSKGDLSDREITIRDYEDFESFIRTYSSVVTCKNVYPSANEFLKSTSSGWVDIEKFFFEKLVQLYDEYSMHKNFIDTRKRLGEINAFMHCIRGHLLEYLKEIERNRGKLAKVAFNTLYNRVYGPASNSEVLFVNFNYTNTLDIYDLSSYRLSSSRVDIHGNINDGVDSLVFGYGDDKDERYKKIEETDIDEFLHHIKAFWYLKKSNYDQVNRFIRRDIFEVKIIGHSCGMSDKVLLSEIFTHGNCQEIEIFYHDRGDGEDDYIEKCYAISRQFPHDQKEAMRKKIRTKDKSIPLVRNSGSVS